MPEAVTLTVDGEPVPSAPGITVAAALESGGRRALRRSVSGQPRGVLCAMGICFECRVTIDGRAHRRACMEIVRDGMAVFTREAEFRVSSLESRVERLDCDVAVVGGGPAGIAAACRAVESGARTLLLDEGLVPGGQIHRHLPGGDPPPAARAWLARLARSGAQRHAQTAVVDVELRGEGWSLRAQRPDGVLDVRSPAVILATGARELFLPFPGWTLPGVLGAGGAQALWKSGASLEGRTAVVGGSGPLLLPVAASLAKAGARVVCVVEQAGLLALGVFGAELLRSPGKLREAAGYRRGFGPASYRPGTWIAEARGRDRLESVIVTDGRRRTEIACDLAAVAYGLTPNTELARLMGCRIQGGGVAVDASQGAEAPAPGVFAAGEICGVAGIEAALAEGQIAGLAAAGRRPAEAWDFRSLARSRAGARRFSSGLSRAFRLRGELARLAAADTVVCRCEDVSLGRIRACGGVREAKLATRCGMGPCQGRVCGPALGFLLGWESDTVRTPIQPAALAALLDPAEEDLA